MTATPVSWQIRRLADAAPVAWRNGGGVTHELAAWPSASAWRWRISVAEVAKDGPFSHFPGVDRRFAVLSGAGVRLAFADKAVSLTSQDAPIAFSGEAACDCQLIDGATLDFNLMSQGLAARLDRFQQGPHFFEAQTSDTLGFFAMDALQIAWGDEVLKVPEQSLCWCVAAQPLRIQAMGASFLGWALSSAAEQGGPA